jgi:hypothetical protein
MQRFLEAVRGLDAKRAPLARRREPGLAYKCIHLIHVLEIVTRSARRLGSDVVHHRKSGVQELVMRLMLVI